MLTVIQAISAIAAAAAAGFWLLSAVQVPGLIQSGIQGSNSLPGLIRKQSMLSAIAAVFAAVSAIAQVTIIYFSAQANLPSHTHVLASKHNSYHYSYSRF
jgi:hypothetical protein